MASVTDTRDTILNIVNEVRRKLGVNHPLSTLATDDWGQTAVNYLNDVVAEINDYGEWQENFLEIAVTASSSVTAYVVNPTLPVHNIREISFDTQVAPLWNESLPNMRRWQRLGSYGIPRFWTIMGVDASSGQPSFRTYPVPGVNENNKLFNCLVYTKPALYDASADVSAIPPYPSRLLVQGLLAEMLLDESRGSDNVDYVVAKQKFNDILHETYNRFNGDSGGDTYFTPGRGGYRKS